MANDFDKPTTDTQYDTAFSLIRGLIADVTKGLDPALSLGTLNTPTNAIRWNSASKYWEKFNGSSWSPLSTDYAITITGGAAKWNTGRTITIGGDANGVSSAWDGSGNVSVNITLSTVSPGKGGTGLTSYTPGDLLYASGATTLSKLAAAAAGNVLRSVNTGQAPSWGKVELDTHVNGTLAVGNGGTGATTVAAARNNLGLVIGTDVMGMAGGTFTGNIAASNLSGTNTGDEPTASTTVQGIVELATNAEVQAGTDGTRAVTPASLRACTATTTRAGVMETSTDAEAKAKASTAVALTPSNLAALMFESGEYTLTVGAAISVAHGLGAVPARVSVCFRCKTAEHGWASGEEIEWASNHGTYSGWSNHMVYTWKSGTNVGCVVWGGEGWPVLTKTTAINANMTPANWRIVLRASLI